MSDDWKETERERLRRRMEALADADRIDRQRDAFVKLVAAKNDRIKALEATLQRCQIVLGNMALENEGAIFNRWPIDHEPLRSDARNLLPVIDAALDEEAGK